MEISFGILKIPYDKKELIKKASSYYVGIMYDRYGDEKETIFGFEGYCLHFYTRELNDIEVMNTRDSYEYYLDDDRIKEMYKFVYCDIINQERYRNVNLEFEKN